MTGAPGAPARVRAAVLGTPIAHSLSPALHRAAYAALGLHGWIYTAIECDEAALPGLLDRIAGRGAGAPGAPDLPDGSCAPDGPVERWAGLSLTMPLKRAVIPLCHQVGDLAARVGAVNTVVLRPPGRRRGENTDVYGIVAALREASGCPAGGSGAGASGGSGVGAAAVYGAGATACSALAALGELGADPIVVYARDPGRAGPLRAAAERLDLRPVLAPLELARRSATADVVVSTLPPHAGDELAPALAGFAGTLLDVAYAPWPSALARAVHRSGGTVVDGLAMLVHQAARQVELMTGCRTAPVEAMRRAAEVAAGRTRPAPR